MREVFAVAFALADLADLVEREVVGQSQEDSLEAREDFSRLALVGSEE
jgi:hypothetical protein